jgi:hypothetical protein
VVRRVLIFLVLLISFSTLATTFNPISIEKQIEEASAAAEVVMTSSRVFKNSSNITTTEYTLEVLESYNIDESNLSDKNRLQISMVGGTIDGITSVVDGAPKFAIEEKSFLLLKKINSQYFISNFSLGKYKIKNVSGETFYVSEVFPEDAANGQISKSKMLAIAKEKWKISSIKTPYIPAQKITSNFEFKKESKVSIGKILSRLPAEELDHSSDSVPMFFWSAFVIFILFFFIIFRQLGKFGVAIKK